MKLEDCTYANTPHFAPHRSIAIGKVVRVYDGDTVHLAFETPLHEEGVARVSVRLLGIDTAEMRSKDDAEKKAARDAKDALSKLMEGKMVKVVMKPETDKYGRCLGTFFRLSDDLNINDEMIRLRHAVAYDGGTKAKIDWATYRTADS